MPAIQAPARAQLRYGTSPRRLGKAISGQTSSDHAPARKKPGLLIREILLTVGAVAGLLCLLAAAAAVFFGVTPVIFRSGSMAPGIDTGALALTRSVPLAEICTGDVVSVFNAAGQRLTHRVAEIRPPRPGSAGELVLKGDANALPDPQPYSVNKADRVFFAVNGWGYPVSFLQTPWSIFAGGLFVGILVFIAFRPGHTPSDAPRGEHRERVKPRRSPLRSAFQRALQSAFQRFSHRRKASGALTILLIAITVFSFGNSGQATLAAFNDSAPASSGTLRSARLLDVTGGISCSESFPNATITWNPAPFLPPEGSYALQVVRLKANGTVDAVMGYYGTANGMTTFTFTPSGALLGLLSGATTFRINIFSVLVSGGGLVDSNGSNILWSSPVATVGNRTILNYPGILLGLAAHVRCDAS